MLNNKIYEQISMTEELLKLQIERMEMMCKSFQANSEKYPEFLPEFEASQSINDILQQSVNLTVGNYNDILKILKNIDLIKHYDGSGWYDYKLHLNSVLRHKGFGSVN
jgi:ABC-type polysaccharide transport system permease subunit